MLGDNAGGNIMLDGGSTCLAIGKIVSMKDVTDKKFKTVISIAKVGDIVFQVCLYSGTTNDGFLVLNDRTSPGTVTWKGNACTIIDLQGMRVAMEQAISLMSAVPQSGVRQGNLSGLPYHVLLIDVDQKIMRRHVGKHILKEKLENVCGFCGVSGCTIQLVSGSGRGKTVTMIAESNGPYKKKFSLKAAETPTKSGPCTNHPVCCDVCKAVVWRGIWTIRLQRLYLQMKLS